MAHITTIKLNDNVAIPVYGFGTFLLANDGTCYKAVTEAIKAGIRHIDTAVAYFNEQEVGKAVKDSGIPREEFFITSKLWLQDFGYEAAKKAIETSLRKLPALYFFFFELGDIPSEKRIWEALFQAVTPRTAGFNTADLGKISDTGLMVTILLMLIGGSPGSTAGGMKTTTATVLVASVVAVFQKKSSANLFGRRIPDDAVRTAAALFFTYVVLFLGGGMIISRMESVPLLTCMFETASAIGTVGLSLGLTPQLCIGSKIILIGLMFFGRVGCLTLVFAAFAEKKNVNAKLPQERITVG